MHDKIKQALPILVLLLLLSIATIEGVRSPLAVSAYTPHQGDYFNYYEVENLGNGSGAYAGYTEQTIVNGKEIMNGVNGSTVSASYSYTYSWSNNEGSSTTASQSGNFAWSDSSFLYVNGTDGQVGYINPTVWFAMPVSTPVGGTFSVLNTPMTVMSRNYSLNIPSEGAVLQGKTVSTIFAQGNGTYYGSPDNNAYGMFNAKYTWDEYFDPTTGYIVGYNYLEQDSNSSGTSFNYSDDLYVTSTSYPLAQIGSGLSTTSLTSTTTSAAAPVSSGFGPYVLYIVALVFIVLIAGVIIHAFSKRGGRGTLPTHPPTTTAPPPQNIDLSPKEQPSVQQVVVREVAKVKCAYCGALIDSTAQVCPVCGAPRS